MIPYHFFGGPSSSVHSVLPSSAASSDETYSSGKCGRFVALSCPRCILLPPPPAPKTGRDIDHDDEGAVLLIPLGRSGAIFSSCDGRSRSYLLPSNRGFTAGCISCHPSGSYVFIAEGGSRRCQRRGDTTPSFLMTDPTEEGGNPIGSEEDGAPYVHVYQRENSTGSDSWVWKLSVPAPSTPCAALLAKDGQEECRPFPPLPSAKIETMKEDSDTPASSSHPPPPKECETTGEYIDLSFHPSGKVFSTLSFHKLSSEASRRLVLTLWSFDYVNNHKNQNTGDSSLSIKICVLLSNFVHGISSSSEREGRNQFQYYRAYFSPSSIHEGDTIITYGSSGHICFWDRASTFTGRKLHAQPGRFGEYDEMLSGNDINAVVYLREMSHASAARVLTADAAGNVCLWTGHRLTSVLSHFSEWIDGTGGISHLEYYTDGEGKEKNILASCGDDGTIRFWKGEDLEMLAQLATADMGNVSLSTTAKILPYRQIEVRMSAPGSSQIVRLLTYRNLSWAQDAMGSIWKIHFPQSSDPEIIAVQNIHSIPDVATATLVTASASSSPSISEKIIYHVNPITVIAMHTSRHLCATMSEDGVVIVWDYVRRNLVARGRFGGDMASFPPACRSAAWRPVNIAGAYDLAVGFEDGTLRILGLSSSAKKAEDGSTLPSLSLVLRHLCRPHSSAIERMKWSEDGRFLATAGKDGAIFIFDGNREDKGGDGGEEDCKKTCELLKPLGCFLISGNAGDVINVVTSIQWIGDDNNHLLYESADGKQWEADVTALIFSTEKQKSISLEVGDPFLRTDIPIKLEEKRKVEGKLNPQSASIYAALVQNIGPKVIFGTSYDDKFLLVADQDGVLAIYRHTSQSPGIPLSSEKKDADGDDHCTHSVLLPSSCIFIKGFPEGSTDLPLGAERSAAIPIVFPPSKCAVHGNTPMIDRLGNSLYTIREVSRRTAEIHRLDTAHKRKDAVRAVVKEMRIEFEELSRKNEGLPAFARLSDEEMTVDPDLVAVWRAEGQGALEEVRRSCEYGQEVSLKKLKKMKTKFLDGMEFESMAVYGIGNRLVARNFPFQKLPKEVQEILNTGPTITGKETESCDLDDNGIKGEKKISNDSTLLSKLEEVNPQENDGTTKTRLQFERKKEISNDSGSSEEKQAMFFVRKEMRQARKQELASLLKCKPSENLDDPSDIAAINLATLTLGNFLLKSSTDYIGQEKMDVQHKLHQMALIAKFMYTKKYQFNQRILTVRDRKAELLKQMDEARQRLLTINNELKKPLPTTQLTWKTIPRPQRDEFPGGRGHFHKNDYNVYILSLEVEGGDDLRAVVSEDLHLPLEVDLNNLEERCVVGEEENKEQMDTMIKTVKTAPSTAPKMTCMKSTEGDDKISNANGADNGDVNDDGAGDEGADEKDTDGGEKSICSIARRHNKLEKIVRLQRERTRICSQVDASIKSFDDDISSLRRERSRLIKDLKMGELSLLTKDRELSLLQGYEHPGRLLSDRLQRIRGERSEISEKIQECAMRIDEKNTERDKAVRKDKVLKEEFLAMAPPQHACHDYFNRIYLKSRKKVLRYMKYAANNHKKSSSGESEDSEYNTDDEGDSESDFESDEDEEEKCPSEGCTEDNFQQILSFREKRWEQEEEYSTIQKELKDIMRERVQLMTRDACIVKEKQGVETEIRDLQQRKQNQFNKLHVFVPLSCSQIHLWDKKENSGTLSQKEKAENSASDTLLEKKDIVITKRTLKSSARLDECVTISSNKFTALRGRIHELRHEIIDASAAFKDLQKERSKLQKQGISKESAIESKKQKCEQLQRLKFGSLVDFDLLDKISERVPQDNDDTEIAERRRKHDRSMGDLNKKRMHLKGRLATFTETNTELLSKIRELSSRQLFLKKELKEKKIGGRKANSAPKEKGAVNCITEAVKKNLSKNNILFKTPTSIADGTVPTRLFDDQNKLEVKIKLQQKKIRSLVDEIHALRGIPPYYEQND